MRAPGEKMAQTIIIFTGGVPLYFFRRAHAWAQRYFFGVLPRLPDEPIKPLSSSKSFIDGILGEGRYITRAHSLEKNKAEHLQ